MADDVERSGEVVKPLKIDDGRGVFAGWPTLVFLAGMLVFAFHACTHMVAAGDTWVAMACGRHHSNHWVDTVEPFSANSHDPGPTKESIRDWPDWARGLAGKFDLETVRKWHPTGWVNQNWLTHTTFYQLASKFGSGDEFNYNALVYWKFIIFTFQAFCIYFFARLIGVSVPMSAVSSAAALCIGRSFLDIRPACYANVLASVLLLIMALSIYKNYRYIWLIVPVTVFWANVHGGYIYVFMMMFPFILYNLLCIPFQNNFYSVGLKGVYHAIGAGFASFFAMVLFNPFHLTNLTHTFEISVSEHAESWRSVNEWHSAFKMDNPVGSSWPFLWMFIVMWIVVIMWGFARFLRPVVQVKTKRRARQKTPNIYKNWPKIDLAVIFIAGLSVYMAVRSRRFIPIAAAAACPVMALMLEQSVRMFLSRRNYDLKGKLEMPALPVMFYRGVIIAAAVATVCFGSFWGQKFKRIYLDPWPMDDIRDSVFMRMTASNVKPFDVCQFMRDNKLSGNMFNYWTEGGAIAFGQTPDPKTGKTPLQLFMDGRAQAAYDHSNFMLWRHLYSGGKGTYNARRENRYIENGSDEMKKVGEFLNTEMKKRDIWVFVLPSNQFVPDRIKQNVNYFPLAMSTHPDWTLVYMDDHQRMYVNKTTKKGSDLLNKVMNDKAKFPNEHSKCMTLARLKLGVKDSREHSQGFELAKKAFEIDQTQAAMAILTYYASSTRNRSLSAKSLKYIDEFLNDFKDNKEAESKEGGYGKKLEAAIVGARHLSQVYENSFEAYSKSLKVHDKSSQTYKKILEQYQKTKGKMNHYSKIAADYSLERGDLGLAYKW